METPGDIVLDIGELEQGIGRGRGLASALRNLLGRGWVEQMKPSPLPSRLGRMKRELDLGQESLARKLRYLFWLN
jgi:hypothetical protein